jgi:hypothetical protein
LAWNVFEFNSKLVRLDFWDSKYRERMKAKEEREKREVNILICSDNFPKSVPARLRSIRNLERHTTSAMHLNLGSLLPNVTFWLGAGSQ